MSSGEADAAKKEEAHEREVKNLQAKIGELTMERDFFCICLQESRSKVDFRQLVDKRHKGLSVRRQCKLLEISRSELYYSPVGESEENLEIPE